MHSGLSGITNKQKTTNQSNKILQNKAKQQHPTNLTLIHKHFDFNSETFWQIKVRTNIDLSADFDFDLSRLSQQLLIKSKKIKTICGCSLMLFRDFFFFLCVCAVAYYSECVALLYVNLGKIIFLYRLFIWIPSTFALIYSFQYVNSYDFFEPFPAIWIERWLPVSHCIFVHFWWLLQY